MKKSSIIFIFLINSFTTYSQKNYISYYITTDLLSAMNSWISKEEQTFMFSGEACLNHEWGFLLNTGLINENSGIYEREGYLISPEVRWYWLNEDCSAPHLGVYFNIEESGYSFYDHGSIPPNHKLNEVIYAIGISAGYKILENDHWAIDPVVYTGFSKTFRRQLEGVNTSYRQSNSEMLIRIALQVGYRF